MDLLKIAARIAGDVVPFRRGPKGPKGPKKLGNVKGSTGVISASGAARALAEWLISHSEGAERVDFQKLMDQLTDTQLRYKLDGISISDGREHYSIQLSGKLGTFSKFPIRFIADFEQEVSGEFGMASVITKVNKAELNGVDVSADFNESGVGVGGALYHAIIGHVQSAVETEISGMELTDEQRENLGEDFLWNLGLSVEDGQVFSS